MTQIRTQNAIRGPKFVRRRKQARVEMIFIQRSAGRSDSIVQQTNNFNQRRKGNLGGQNCSNREHEYICRPNIVKTCFTCRRYTVKSHAWENQQHACYSIYIYRYEHIYMSNARREVQVLSAEQRAKAKANEAPRSRRSRWLCVCNSG